MTDAFSFRVTKTLFRVRDFLSWQRHGQLELRPAFQRQSVWSRKAKSYFIDSILRNYPIPVIIIQDQTTHDTDDPLRQVVDGQQRLRTALAFVDASCLQDLEPEDSFSILRAHNKAYSGKTFRELPQEARTQILDYEFSVHILPSSTPEPQLLEIFARMNSSGYKLNPQELRNARFFGECKQACYQLSQQQIHNWLDLRVFSRSQIATMKDVEMTSELLLGIRDGLSAKSQSALDDFYEKNDDVFEHEALLSERFTRTMDLFAKMFLQADNSGLRALGLSTQGWFYVLFLLVHDELYGSNRPPERKKPKRVGVASLRERIAGAGEKLKRQLASDALEPEVLKSLRGAATDRRSRKARMLFLKEAMNGSGKR